MSIDVLERPKTQVTFSWEPFKKLLTEPNINDMLTAHWHELGVHKDQMPLDPDYEYMLECAERNFFMVWAARDGKTLVGYIAFWIKPHTHYKSTLTAVEDLYYLSASYRKGTTGIRLFTTAMDALKRRGVKRVIVNEKVHFEQGRGGLGAFLRRLEFIHTDNLYSRML
jgi:L-amino acid N-acyltransferase YncA